MGGSHHDTFMLHIWVRTNMNITTFDKPSCVYTRFILQQFSGKIIIVHLIRFDNCQVVL